MPYGRRFSWSPSIHARAGFTLVELLVSIGIIMLLLAMLFPVLTTAREQSNSAVCSTHLHALWQGWVGFANDHDGCLPGCMYNYWPPQGDPDHYDWLCGGGVAQNGDAWSVSPQNGTIFKYISNNYPTYLCPSLEPMPPAMFNQGPGVGSNGRFDYAAFLTFNGSRLYNVPSTATFTDPTTGQQTIYPTPLICDGDPAYLNGQAMYGSQLFYCRLPHRHQGGANYISPDGSIHRIVATDGPYNSDGTAIAAPNSGAMCWTVTTRRGTVVNMGEAWQSTPNTWNVTWGQFDAH